MKETLEARTSTDMVKKLEKVINTGIEKSFEKKVSRKKTPEPSWISDAIRANIKCRRAIFRREGRSENWWAITWRKRTRL